MEMSKCDRCSELVSPFELPEHLDFHLAQDSSGSSVPQVASISNYFDKTREPSDRCSNKAEEIGQALFLNSAPLGK